MCAAVSVKVCYRVGETEGNGDVCCIYRYGLLQGGGGRRREMVMCAAFSVMFCYRVGETEGNGDVCCI